MEVFDLYSQGNMGFVVFSLQLTDEISGYILAALIFEGVKQKVSLYFGTGCHHFEIGEITGAESGYGAAENPVNVIFNYFS